MSEKYQNNILDDQVIEMLQNKPFIVFPDRFRGLGLKFEGLDRPNAMRVSGLRT